MKEKLKNFIKRENFKDGIVFLALGLALFFHSLVKMEEDKGGIELSPYLFPIILGGAIAVFAVQLMFTGTVKEKNEDFDAKPFIRAVFITLLAVVYLVLLNFLPYLPVTVAYIFLFMLCLKNKEPLKSFIIAAVSAGLLYLIFGILLRVGI